MIWFSATIDGRFFDVCEDGVVVVEVDELSSLAVVFFK